MSCFFVFFLQLPKKKKKNCSCNSDGRGGSPGLVVPLAKPCLKNLFENLFENLSMIKQQHLESLVFFTALEKSRLA